MPTDWHTTPHHEPGHVLDPDGMKESKMTNRIAEKDIIERNELGQTVVRVHAGAPIPDDVEVAEDGVTVVKPDESAEGQVVHSGRSRSKKAD
jgi:hypothetical protein